MTLNELKDKVSKVIDKDTNKEIGHKAIKKINILPNGNVELKLAIKNFDKKRELKIEITKLIKIDLGFKGLVLEVENIQNINHFKYLLISSGKGGVGKSTVSIELAKAFSRLGIKAGILDADLYGPSIPNLLEYEKTEVKGDKYGNMKPVLSNCGIEFISVDLFLPKNTPLMWRGPLLNKILNPFFTEVHWDLDTKLVIVDLPPGTGDVHLDTKKYCPNAKTIVVTTPSSLSTNVCIKASRGSKKLGLDIIGIIENMSYFLDENNKKHYLLGKENIDITQQEINTKLLAQIPFKTQYTKDLIENIYEKIAQEIATEMKL